MDETKYEREVDIVKTAIHNKLWRKTDDQHNKWAVLLQNLCELHNVELLELVVNDKVVIPHYIRGQKICLNKYSVISFLHEFGHHIEMSEAECKSYSETVFLKAYPKAEEYLSRDVRGYLTK